MEQHLNDNLKNKNQTILVEVLGTTGISFP